MPTVYQSPGVLGAAPEPPARPIMGDSLNLELAGRLDQQHENVSPTSPSTQAEIELDVEQNSIFAPRPTCEVEADVSWAADIAM